MKNEFVLAFNEVLEEKQLPKDVIIQALEAAMVSAYRRAVNASNAQHVEAKIDPETGRVIVYAEKEIVEEVQDERTEVTLEVAQSVEPNSELGGMVVVETTPADFGRVAAQTARQVIQQRIKEAERDTQLQFYGKQVGEIVSGIVQAVTPPGVTLGLDMKAEGILPRNQQVPGERFRVHDRIQALLLEVKQSPRGPQIILSRSHRNFLRRLLENEVPEIYHGLVEIRSIAREPGQRSKVAVAALQPAVDPVGACVGIRGVRIQAIVRELNDEKIDVIEWDPDPISYIAKALSPARVTGVYLNEQAKGAKTATVVVPEDQLSLAIGRDGQNARLAAKLTTWRIDIKSLPEATADAYQKLTTDPEYASMAESESSVIPQIDSILLKKAEGRPVTPEEYQTLSQFVDRVERGIIHRRTARKRAEDERRIEIRSHIPEAAFVMPLEDLGLSERFYTLLNEAEMQSVGDLMLQMAMNSDAILAIDGIGPKAMAEIEETLAKVNFPVEETPLEEALLVEEVTEIPALETPEVMSVPVDSEIMVSAPLDVMLSPIDSVVAEGAILVDEAMLGEADLVKETKPESVIETITDELISEPVHKEVEQELVLEESLDELFTLKPEAFSIDEVDEEEEDEDGFDRKTHKKKKAKKKRAQEMEYDPDRDIMLVKRKRKHGLDWEDDWSK